MWTSERASKRSSERRDHARKQRAAASLHQLDGGGTNGAWRVSKASKI